MSEETIAMETMTATAMTTLTSPTSNTNKHAASPAVLVMNEDGHEVQVLLCVSEYELRGHKVQFTSPTPLNEPRGHD